MKDMMEENVNLGAKSSFKIGGRTKAFFAVHNQWELQEALMWAEKKKVKPIVVGGLTNVLLPDEELEMVIQLAPNNSIELLGAGRIKAWAGEKMAAAAWETVRADLSGWEGFTSLPGTIGGALWNNSHYDQTLLSDTVLEVTYYDWQEQGVRTKTKEELDFAYEQSWFQKNEVIILEALFQLQEVEGLAESNLITEKALASTRKRKETQPLDLPSAGCFWQNPINTAKLRALFPQFAARETIPAGFLIEQVGLKGKKIGGAQVSEKHAAFIVNAGAAKSADVKVLTQEIKKVIKEKFEVELKSEVVIIGNQT